MPLRLDTTVKSTVTDAPGARSMGEGERIVVGTMSASGGDTSSTTVTPVAVLGPLFLTTTRSVTVPKTARAGSGKLVTETARSAGAGVTTAAGAGPSAAASMSAAAAARSVSRTKGPWPRTSRLLGRRGLLDETTEEWGRRARAARRGGVAGRVRGHAG